MDGNEGNNLKLAILFKDLAISAALAYLALSTHSHFLGILNAVFTGFIAAPIVIRGLRGSPSPGRLTHGFAFLATVAILPQVVAALAHAAEM